MRCVGDIQDSQVGSQVHLLPLHASLSPVEQKLVFVPPPKGKRKVVIATNIAETSITMYVCVKSRYVAFI